MGLPTMTTPAMMRIANTIAQPAAGCRAGKYADEIKNTGNNPVDAEYLHQYDCCLCRLAQKQGTNNDRRYR